MITATGIVVGAFLTVLIIASHLVWTEQIGQKTYGAILLINLVVYLVLVSQFNVSWG